MDDDDGASPSFYDPWGSVESTKGHLPHWHQDQVYVFVTWRLADAIPKAVADRIHGEQEIWLKLHPKPWSQDEALEYRVLFSNRIEELLDTGSGSCILRNPRASQVVVDALRHFDGQRYNLDAFVVMPNHVHALFRLTDGARLQQVLHSWKSFTSNQLRPYSTRPGPIWQSESHDRLVRNAQHLFNCRMYIESNPVRARLKPGEFALWAKSTDE